MKSLIKIFSAILSSVIIMVIFGVVITSSFVILREGFISQTSNAVILAKMINRQSEVLHASTQEEKVIYQIPRSYCLFGNPEQYVSLVDFLNTYNIDSSLQSRQKMANSIGIVGYSGSANQNYIILNYTFDLLSKMLPICT